MTPLLWLLALVGLVLALIAGFFLGRGAGLRAAEAQRSTERLEMERQLGAERALLAQSTEKVLGAERERDVRMAELLLLRKQFEDLRSASGRVDADAAAVRQQVDSLAEQLHDAEGRERALAASASLIAEKLQDQLGRAEQARARLETELLAERAVGAERLETARRAEEERKELFVGARLDMANSFEKLAAGILEDKSKRFTEHNRTNIDQLLHPLREKLGEFQLKVEGLQQDGVIGRTELKTQIEALRGMNEKLSLDANNLVKALKNSSKQQGDWGEVILLGMLDEAGLRPGKEYRVQESFANEEGRQSRPDVILNLPGDKHLVIDSKVSLNSYTEYCACDDDSSRTQFLDRHARSLRDHIDGLSKKSYQTLHQLRSLDFVVMFVPIEPAYLLALAHDGGLWQRAWKRDVLLVSPGTLFPVIRTIAHIWQQDRQTRNVEEILKQASGLYDKVATFAESFEDVGKRLEGTRNAYDKAFGQLATGNGHVLGRISKLRTLGLKTSKKLPANLAGDEAEHDGEDPGDADTSITSQIGLALAEPSRQD